MKCNRKTRTRCEALQMAVDSKAVEVPLMFNFQTSKQNTDEFAHGVRVNQTSPTGKKLKKTLLFFNTCPWCSTQLLNKP